MRLPIAKLVEVDVLVDPAAVAAVPLTVTAPPVGAVESFVSVSVATRELPKLSFPVTVSVGALVVPPLQLNAPETYGPPAGVVTVEPVNVQPVAVPARVANALDAGPELASVSAFVSVNEPAVEPR